MGKLLNKVETDLDLENNTYGDIEKYRYEVLEYWEL